MGRTIFISTETLSGMFLNNKEGLHFLYEITSAAAPIYWIQSCNKTRFLFNTNSIVSKIIYVSRKKDSLKVYDLTKVSFLKVSPPSVGPPIT